MRLSLFTITLSLLPSILALILPSPDPPQLLGKRIPIVSLGLAKTYGVLAYTALTSTGATVITGSCGTYPGTAITGFPPGVCTVSTSAGGSAASAAQAACGTAYNNALANPTTTSLAVANLGGLTLGPGVYTPSSISATLSGTLTLNGAGNPNGQFIFKISTTFTTAALSKIALINGAKACNVYFAVGSSASIGAQSALQGNIIAYTSISASNAVTNSGTWCALNGAVTLINDKLAALTTCTSAQTQGHSVVAHHPAIRSSLSITSRRTTKMAVIEALNYDADSESEQATTHNIPGRCGKSTALDKAAFAAQSRDVKASDASPDTRAASLHYSPPSLSQATNSTVQQQSRNYNTVFQLRENATRSVSALETDREQYPLGSQSTMSDSSAISRQLSLHADFPAFETPSRKREAASPTSVVLPKRPKLDGNTGMGR
ncbi:unnamed protein product [Diplocarpon coronariae]